MGSFALIEASASGHVDVVNRLLECKEVEVNLQDQVNGKLCWVVFLFMSISNLTVFGCIY